MSTPNEAKISATVRRTDERLSQRAAYATIAIASLTTWGIVLMPFIILWLNW